MIDVVVFPVAVSRATFLQLPSQEHVSMRKSLLIKFAVFIIAASALSFLQIEQVFAQEDQLDQLDQTLAQYSLAIDTVWVLIAGFLVFFMQAGFAFLEAGFVRAKNVGNILMENFIDTAITGLTFWAVGFGIMFGAGSAIIGREFFFLLDIPDTYGGVPTLAFFFFQFAFSAAASTIASGAMSERVRFKSDLVYSVIVSALIYPVVGHWIWQGDGWLAQLGFADFAGSTVVHSTGAYVGLIGAMFLGPRKGKSFRSGAEGIPGHSMTMAALGTFVLWLGWFGFNPGSTISGMAANDIALITVNTNLAACMGAIVAVFIGWYQSGVPQLPWAFNGALAGLVAITAPCAWVTPGESILIGGAGAVAMYAGVILLERFKIDDPVGAVGVHGFGGICGTLAVGLFANVEGGPIGLLHGGGSALLLNQAIGVIAVMGFVVGSSVVMFGGIKAIIGLRVPVQAEDMGLDVYEHGLNTYPEFTNGFGTPTTPTPGSPHAEPELNAGLTPSSSPAVGD
jgi:Amt family ammonium transporter